MYYRDDKGVYDIGIRGHFDLAYFPRSAVSGLV